jgi:hypothetical protein
MRSRPHLSAALAPPTSIHLASAGAAGLIESPGSLRSPSQCGAIAAEPMFEDEDGAIAPVAKLAIEERSFAGS